MMNFRGNVLRKEVIFRDNNFHMGMHQKRVLSMHIVLSWWQTNW